MDGGVANGIDVDLGQARVLVVEDNEINRTFACVMLESMGITQVECANNGAEGLVKVAAFEPDLILLDLMMPVMDGQQFLRALRADPARVDLPVLVTTAVDSQDMRNALFGDGASDYVNKPIDRQELVARVRVHLRQTLLLRDLRRYYDRLAFDLATARSMQDALLPSPIQIGEAEARYTVSIAASFSPSSELGGDLWGLLPVDDHRLAVFAVDFSGHGVAASINTFRLHMLLRGADFSAADPAKLLGRLNASLFHLLPRGQFATMVVAMIDTAARSLTIANAGSPSPILGEGGGTRLMTERHPPLGITLGARYENLVLPFGPGCHLALYSDGMAEADNVRGEALGDEGVRRLLTANIGATSEQTVMAMMAAFAQESPAEPADDLTFVWIAVEGPPAL